MLVNLLAAANPISKFQVTSVIRRAANVYRKGLRSRPVKLNSTRKCPYLLLGSGLVAAKQFPDYIIPPPKKPLKVIALKSSGDHVGFKYFLYIILKDFWLLIGSIAAAVIAAYLNIQIPLRLGDVINSLMEYNNFESSSGFVKKIVGDANTLVLMYLGQAAATCSYITFLSWLGENLAFQIKVDLLRNILYQDIAFFDSERTGSLTECISNDVHEFKSSFKLFISHGLRSTIQIFGSVVSLFLISTRMSIVVLSVLPVVILVGTVIGGQLRHLSKEAQASSIRSANTAQEAISNIRTVRAFANEETQLKVYSDDLEVSRQQYKSLGAGIGVFQAGTNLFLNGVVLGTMLLGANMLQHQDMSPGSLMSFLVTTQTIQRSFTQLSLLFGQVVKGVQAAGRISQLMSLKPSVPIKGGSKIGFHSFIPSVNFKGVTFSYPSRPSQVILKKLDLTIPAGKKVAIVGASGNGKSTIASLLVRFYDVDDGSIEVGGEDIRNLDPSWLRGTAIGMINQEPVLFATSIKENIRFGKPTATDEEVIEAAKLANAHEFINSFPDGYNTVVGERGVTVSGGQKQRIAIARALIKNPSILVLDEATSALDPESERQVQVTLEQISKGRTVLVIAHRLSTIQDAHLIVVLQKGEIVEMGNHGELVAKKGAYYHLMAQEDVQKC